MSPDVALLLLSRTGAILGVALLAARLTRRMPVLRLAVCRLALVAVVALTIATPWSDERPQPMVPVFMPSYAKVAVSPPPARISGAARTGAIAASFDPAALILPFWVGGMALLTLRLLMGYVALARLRRGCHRSESTEMAAIARETGIAAPAVYEGDAVGAPFVAGALRPIVFMPADWRASVAPDVLEAVLRHEAAHVANGDLRWNILRRWLEIVLWPQPLLWFLARPMANASEELCDRRVLAAGVDRTHYAKCLLSLRIGSCPALAIGAVASRSALGQRIEAILDARRSRAIRLSRSGVILVRLAALGLAAGTALVFARPTTDVSSQAPLKDGILHPYAGRVRLRSADGKPILGAKAWLVGNDGKPARPLTVEGEEVVVPDGISAPDDSSGTLAVQAPGQGLGFVRLWPGSKKVEALDLPTSVSVKGRLVLPDGTPAAGLKVRPKMMVRLPKGNVPLQFMTLEAISDLGMEDVTAVDGTFTLVGLTPDVELAYDTDDLRYAQPHMEDRVHLGSSGTTKAKSLILRPAARLMGRVLRDGRPVAGLLIGAQNTNDSIPAAGNAMTDADGRYVIGRLPAAAYNVIADLSNVIGGSKPHLDAEVTAIAHKGVVLKPGETKSGLDFALIPGSFVEGRVTDATGKPAILAGIGIYGPAHPNSSAWVQVAKVDREGRYRARVPAGKQYVYVYDSTWEAAARTVAVEDGGTVRVDFQVVPKAPDRRP